MRHATGNRTYGGDAVCGEVQSCAGRGGSDDGKQRARHRRSEPAKSEDGSKHKNGDEQRRKMYMVKVAADVVELSDGPVGGTLQTEHLGQNGDANLKSDPRKKAREHGLREEVGDEAELQQTREEQESSGEESDQAGQSNISGACSRSHVDEATAKNGRSG